MYIKRFTCLSFIIPCFIFSTKLYATVYYLDNAANGSDSGLSISNAFTSFDKAMAVVKSGDTLLISGGNNSKTYFLNSTIKLPSNFKFAVIPDDGHNGKVIIDGQDIVTPLIELKNQSNITIDGGINGKRHLIFQNWGGTANGKKPSTAVSGYGTGKLISDLTIRYIEIINDDTICSASDCSDIVLKRCAHLGRTGGGTLIEHNYFEGCIRENLVLGTGGKNKSRSYEDNIVQYNEFKGFRRPGNGKGGPDGIKGGGNTTIRFNKIYHEGLQNAEYNPSHSYEDGIQLLYPYNKVYGNLVYGYSQGAIRTDAISPSYSTKNLFIYNNVLYSTGKWGAQRGIALDGGIGGFYNVHIYNNTIVDFSYRGILIGTKPKTKTAEINIFNNILVDSPLVVKTNGDTSLVTIDYNLCLDKSYNHGGCETQEHDPYRPEKSFNFTRHSFGSTNNDLSLIGTDNMAIGAGKELSSFFTNDYLNMSRNEIWDLGAIKYSSNKFPTILNVIAR